VFIDTLGGARVEAGDLIQAEASGAFRWDDVRADLGELCRHDHPGRGHDAMITLFKSVGCAVEDLTAARLVQAAMLAARG
jgi:ornithine cyclodeaminase